MKQRLLLKLLAQRLGPHEAQTMADLMTPFQGEEIRGLCKQLKTEPVIECAAMFSDDVNFYQLHTDSAQALIEGLKACLVAQ